MSLKLLTFDVATHTGWCFGPSDGTPEFGSIRFNKPGDPPVIAWAAAIPWITERVRGWEPDMVILEAPLPPSHVGGKTNVNTARMLMGMSAIFETIPHMLGVPRIREVHVQTVRKFFIGNGRMPSKEAKLATIARCLELGHDVGSDNNKADAVAIWYYGVEVVLRP